MNKIKILVVGCGNMGTSHARAYQQLEAFEIVGLVSRTPDSRERLSKELGGIRTFDDYKHALEATQPEAVSINTYPDTHAKYVEMALKAHAHVFVEKPIATSVDEAKSLISLAQGLNRVIVVGYILRVHPSWAKFVQLSRNLGKPLVMRMNLNQQSSGLNWETHKNLMHSMSPIVDCGVHYIDIMCSMTQSKPISVHAIGARLSGEISSNMYNYGQLQVRFEDGSVGWYEAGWGPMMSNTAYFIKDVIGPKGSISMADKPEKNSDDIDEHTQTGGLIIHHSQLDESGTFAQKDQWIDMNDEPDHDALCLLEQELFLEAIRGNYDTSSHLQEAVDSLKVVLAADESFKTGTLVHL